jgi:hypothetical protein
LIKKHWKFNAKPEIMQPEIGFRKTAVIGGGFVWNPGEAIIPLTGLIKQIAWDRPGNQTRRKR